jgi:glycosyltransferase involved in cell wall biosynthesis
VDCYISLTEFARKKMIEGGLPAEKIRVKPNFVLPDPGRRTNSGDYALFVGRLEELKGVPTMLSAWEQLPKSIPLVIAGDGAYRVGMEAEITKRQLSHVNYKGRLSREKTLEAMKNARFLIFPSEWYEGFPVTIAESFACGVPVICSRMGSMQEIVDDHRCGLHFTPGDASDLAAKVQWAWSHPEDVDMMGHQARVDFETRYSAARNYEMLSEIYGSVMAGRESRGPKVGAS